MIAGVFAALLVLGVPVAYVLVITGLIYILYSENTVLYLSFLQKFFEGLESYGLLAIPLFMLVAEIMNKGGLVHRLVAFARIFVSGLRGGLAYINLIANMMMASILGSATAQMSMMAQVMVPEMEKRGYDRTFAAATTAAGGLLSPIIPPSMMFIVFAVLAQLDVGKMLIAGIVPGILLTAAFLLVIMIMGFKYGYPKDAWLTRPEIFQAIKEGFPPLIVPVVIIGSIMLGIATPTESAAIAAVAAWIIGHGLYRELKLSDLGPILFRTGMNSALILFLITAANVFGWVLVFEEIPQTIAAWISGLTTDPFVFMLMIMVLLLLTGMIIDSFAALILSVPILLPIAQGNFGIDPFHFGVVVCINLILGLLTPPVGTGLYVCAAMSNCKPAQIFFKLVPFLAVTLGMIILLSWQDGLVTWLLQ